MDVVRPIAVLSSNIHWTYKWANKHFNIKEANTAQRRFVTEDGREYIIVCFPEHIKGLYFSGYIKAPDYVTLEDEIRARVI